MPKPPTEEFNLKGQYVEVHYKGPDDEDNLVYGKFDGFNYVRTGYKYVATDAPRDVLMMTVIRGSDQSKWHIPYNRVLYVKQDR